MNKLDIIIPAYNADKTINRALHSIAVQNIDFDISVYIVNDCSKNDYKENVEFFSRYFNIKEYTLNENGGPGVARQYGIDNSYGEYITFLDSDDFFSSPNSLKKLIEGCKESPDLVISQVESEICGKKIIYTEKDFTYLHGKVYRRAFLRKNNIRFNNTRSDEDNGFNYLVKFLSPKIAYVKEPTYYYYENEESITRSSTEQERFNAQELFIYNINWALSEAINRAVISAEMAKTCLRTIIVMYLANYKLNGKNKEQFNKWIQDIKTNYNMYFDKFYTKNQIQSDLELVKMDVNCKEEINFDNFYNFLKGE